MKKISKFEQDLEIAIKDGAVLKFINSYTINKRDSKRLDKLAEIINENKTNIDFQKLVFSKIVYPFFIEKIVVLDQDFWCNITNSENNNILEYALLKSYHDYDNFEEDENLFDDLLQFNFKVDLSKNNLHRNLVDFCNSRGEDENGEAVIFDSELFNSFVKIDTSGKFKKHEVSIIDYDLKTYEDSQFNDYFDSLERERKSWN